MVKYLKFELMGPFTCFPNGLAFCPREIYKTVKISSFYATSHSEALHHVNFLEMLAVLLTLRPFKRILKANRLE